MGSSGAGATPAGFDASTTTEERRVSKIAAYLVDGATRDFVRDADGKFVGQHPVDAKVWHRLRIFAGSVRSAPATGQSIGGAWIDNKTIDAFVRDQVTQTLADMVAAGDITVRAITVDTAVRGRVMFQCDYVNNRTGSPGSFRSV
jgi:hypothetical protein